MQSNIRESALRLGYLDARPVTGQPFEAWAARLKSLPLGQYMEFEHDPAKVTGWPGDEITIWVALAPTPPLDEWPQDRGEMAAHYMTVTTDSKRREAWKQAVTEMGYEVAKDVHLPERAAAVRAGLGIGGLNGLLISPEYGSFTSISIVVIRAKPPTDARGQEHDIVTLCEQCGKCVAVCPSRAISADNGIDALRCLCNSIYRPEYMPETDYDKMGKRIQGCDSCQMVCPHNSHLELQTLPTDIVESMALADLLNEPDIETISKYCRTHLSLTRLKTQAILAAANTNRQDLLPLIVPHKDSNDQPLAAIATWAEKRLAGML